jgi:hypothetical protein
MPKEKKLPLEMGFWQFWGQSVSHSFTRAWIGVGIVSGALAIFIPCARLLSANPRYQTFCDILEHYWLGWILVVVFLAVLIYRAAYAPFLIYKEQLKSVGDLEGRIEELEDRLTPKIIPSCDNGEQCKLVASDKYPPRFRTKIF